LAVGSPFGVRLDTPTPGLASVTRQSGGSIHGKHKSRRKNALT
jgi:hypothetical protein